MSDIAIYFGEKPVYLCDKITDEIEEIKRHPDAIYIDELSSAAINSLLHEINKPQFHAGIIFNKDFKKLCDDFFKHFKLIQTGGGLVKNNDDEILLIFRRGKWDLPKGKLENNETLEACALREVQEETGLQQLKIVNKINVTYHVYAEFGKKILKESHWYTMLSTINEALVPQTEEDITDIKWVKKKDLENYVSNSFPTIAAVLKNA